MIWSLIQSVGGQASIMAVYLLLATILSPADFGLVGLATVWTAILGAFSEAGFGAALIQRREITEGHASTTFALNIGVGVALSAVGVLISQPVAEWFDEPRLGPVLAVLSLAFVLRSFGLTHVAMAQRHLRFRSLAMRDIGANTTAGLIGFVLALRDAGVWSLVAVTLASAAIGSALMWRIDAWRPSPRLVSRRALLDLWQFSSSILGFNVFKAVVQNIDRLIVGHLLGTTAVGYYSFASRLTVQPLAVPIGALGVYLFPRIARDQDNHQATHDGYRQILSLSLAIAMPFAIGATVLASPLVPRVFGTEWRPAIPLVGWLAMAAVARALYSPATQLMKGLGRPDLMRRWSVAITGLTAGALFLGARWGLAGVGIAFAVAHIAGMPLIIGMVGSLSGFGFRLHISAMARSILLGGVTAIALAEFAKWAGTHHTWIIGVTVLMCAALTSSLLLTDRDVTTRLRTGWGNPA